MTTEEIEAIVKRTLGRTVDASPDSELRTLVAAYDGAVAAKDETIRLLREQVEMYRQYVSRISTQARTTYDLPDEKGA